MEVILDNTVNITIDFSLIDTTNDESSLALAAISLNPAVTWTKFILTDDLPNANSQRIPVDEFDNLIKTGIYMPIKMAAGKINDGHSDSVPIGVITHLKRINNQIMGLAALWDAERPEDVSYIKDRYKNNQPLQLSWEIFYSMSETKEDGVNDLKGTILRAVTLVGMPAYEGRTPIVAVASTGNTIKENNSNTMEELEQLKQKVAELETSLSGKDTELTAKVTEIETLNAELETLKAFKASIELEKTNAEKLDSIKTKFKEAGIERDEQYFETNKAMLLSLSAEALDFMVQDLVSFASKNTGTNTSNSSANLPPLSGGKTTPTTDDLIEYLRSRISKQE